MDSPQFRKKKKPHLRLKSQKSLTSSSSSPSSSSAHSRYLYLLLLPIFFFLFLLKLDKFPSGSHPFHPILTISRLSPLSIQSSSSGSLPPLKLQERITFPDHILLIVSKIDPSLLHFYRVGLECLYPSQHETSFNSTNWAVLPVLSVDGLDRSRSIARCPVPPANHSSVVSLRRHGLKEEEEEDDEEKEENGLLMVHSWDNLVYEGVLDGNTAVVFVKGLNLRPDRASDPAQFMCHFGWGSIEKSTKYVLTSSAITAAQEVIKCSFPRSFIKFPEKSIGVRITVSSAHHPNSHNHLFPSVAKLSNLKKEIRIKMKKHELCVCTMVWNQAMALREWIIYHSWLGIERWFIYDNNSDDGIKEVIDELEQENYNVSRYTWPWIKTQEAGFSHCALSAKSECNWVGFFDVDEFFYFPVSSSPRFGEFGYPGRDSLRALVANLSSSPVGIGEIRTTCHSFGPSGLTKHPPQGVTSGYTCRLQSPERHKSIARLDALDETLLNVVHHFHLKEGYTYINLPQSTALINHYKYQVWESFKAKFFRRVATYVADWQENQNEGSKDRAPGLGTEAIEPVNWSRRFCEVWDTGLRDFVMTNLADPETGLLPWERSVL